MGLCSRVSSEMFECKSRTWTLISGSHRLHAHALVCMLEFKLQTELIRFDFILALNYSCLSSNFPGNNLIMQSSRRAPGWVAL